MSKDMLLERKLQHLYARKNDGMKFGLEVQRALMKALGSPQESYAVVHVAGSNGKGSVCAMLASILRTAGLKVGLYTSPHLVEFNERISVCGSNVTDEELVALAAGVDAAVPSVLAACGREPTFFEYSTAMAFRHFANAGVHIAVIETGLGGRLDATNICEPALSVITGISIEHSAYLGNTIAAIAGEKAGIIKHGRPVVCGAMDAEAGNVVFKRAGEMSSLCRDAAKTVSVNLVKMDFAGSKVDVSTDENTYGRMLLPLTGIHQITNLATAVAAAEEIQRVLDMEFAEGCIKKGVEGSSWPGRCQLLSLNPPVLLDGAHNPAGAHVLADTLKRIAKDRPLCLILGMCSDKDIAGFLSNFSMAKLVYTVSFNNDRAVPAADLCARVKAAGLSARAAELGDALNEASLWAAENNGVVCVTGSLFLAGEVLERKAAG